MRFLNASVLERKALNRNLSWGFPLGNLLPKTRVLKHRVLERKRRPNANASVLGTQRFRTLRDSQVWTSDRLPQRCRKLRMEVTLHTEPYQFRAPISIVLKDQHQHQNELRSCKCKCDPHSGPVRDTPHIAQQYEGHPPELKIKVVMSKVVFKGLPTRVWPCYHVVSRKYR